MTTLCRRGSWSCLSCCYFCYQILFRGGRGMAKARRPWTKNDSSGSKGGKRLGKPRLEGGGSRFDVTLPGTLCRRHWCRPATFKIVAPTAAADRPHLIAFLFTAAAGETTGSASADEGHVVLLGRVECSRPPFTRYAGPRAQCGESRSQSLRQATSCKVR